MAQIILYPANSRGLADHGWLKSFHTFSFGSYYNPERIQFGALRVLNDDSVSEGRGFGEHPHDNMEIISIPLEGELIHQDSMGNKAVIKAGEIQVMSAGTGIYHSEYNHHRDEPVKFLQIWLFPNKRNVEPRYQQMEIDPSKSHNQFQQILSPNPDDEGVWIYQNAWFHQADLDKGFELDYHLKANGNGVFVFVLEGDVLVQDQALRSRDGLGMWDADQIAFKALSKAKVLLMEVPMM